MTAKPKRKRRRQTLRPGATGEATARGRELTALVCRYLAGEAGLRQRIHDAIHWYVRRLAGGREIGRKQSIDHDDLIQAGHLGVEIALARFDPALGKQFTTYASPWIWRCMQDAIEDALKIVHVPRGSFSYFLHKRRQREDATVPDWEGQHHQTDRTYEEIERALFECRSLDRRWVEDIHVRGEARAFALNDPEDYRDETALERMVRLEEAAEARRVLRKALASLNERDRAVVRAIYGIGGDWLKAGDSDVAAQFGVSRQRIFQIKERFHQQLAKYREAS